MTEPVWTASITGTVTGSLVMSGCIRVGVIWSTGEVPSKSKVAC